MRHRRSRLRLTQKPAHARMLQRNLVTSLLLYESVRTTKKRAKVVQPVVDHLIHYAKSHPPHVAIRYLNRMVTDKNASRKVMEVYCKRYAGRASGLSRMVPIGARRGDGADLVQLTLVDAVIGRAAKEEGAAAGKGAAKKQPAKKKPVSSAKKK